MTFSRCVQPVRYISGHVDKAVLERMGKIMSYLRVTAGKPTKKPKKDKLAALHGMGSVGGTNFPIVHGTDNIMPKPASESSCLVLMLGAANHLHNDPELLVITRHRVYK